MNADLIAGAAVFTAGLLCLHLRRSPVVLLLRGLLHIQAVWLCAREVIPMVWRTARGRYRECYERARREVGQ